MTPPTTTPPTRSPAAAPAPGRLSPSFIAFPLWLKTAAVAAVAHVAFLFAVRLAFPKEDHAAELTGLGWLCCVMVAPAAWLCASIVLGRRLSRRPLRPAIPLLLWSALAPFWMTGSIAAAAITATAGLLSDGRSGVVLTPLFASLALGPATLTSVLVAVLTRSRAAAVACLVAMIPALGALLFFGSVEAAPATWALIVTFFILRAEAASGPPSPAARATSSPPPSTRPRPATPRQPAPPGPACPGCGYTGPSSLGAPCPGCGEYTG